MTNDTVHYVGYCNSVYSTYVPDYSVYYIPKYNPLLEESSAG